MVYKKWKSQMKMNKKENQKKKKNIIWLQCGGLYGFFFLSAKKIIFITFVVTGGRSFICHKSIKKKEKKNFIFYVSLNEKKKPKWILFLAKNDETTEKK